MLSLFSTYNFTIGYINTLTDLKNVVLEYTKKSKEGLIFSKNNIIDCEHDVIDKLLANNREV